MISLYKLFEWGPLIAAAQTYGPRVMNAAAPYVNKAVDVAKPLVQRGATTAGNIATKMSDKIGNVVNPIKNTIGPLATGNVSRASENLSNSVQLSAPKAIRRVSAFNNYGFRSPENPILGKTVPESIKDVKDLIKGSSE